MRNLVSFADNSLWRSATRLRTQADATGWFDEVLIFNEDDVRECLPPDSQYLLSPEIRGFGYWIWKPAAILQALSRIARGDSLLYLDVGCHLNPRGLNRMETYFRTLEEDEFGLIGFQSRPPLDNPTWDGRPLPQYPDAQWAKGDVLDFFDVRSNEKIILEPTIGAGVILLRNTPEVEAFIRQWLTIMVEHHSLIDDSPSSATNHPWFIENRHDQAIFSILAKLRGIHTFSAFEYWYPKQKNAGKPDWSCLTANPILAIRDLDFGHKKNISRRLVNLHKRLMRRLPSRSRS